MVSHMRHTTASVYATFEKPVNMYRGTTMAGIIKDEARNDPSRGFVGGYELETLSLGLPFLRRDDTALCLLHSRIRRQG